MKRSFWVLLLVGAALLMAAPVMAQDFYVIAGGGPPVGTKITSLPYNITSPGFYYLTGNLSASGNSEGIIVNSDDVTIDLMGFGLSGTGNTKGIYMNGRKNVEVRNGTLNGWTYGILEFSDTGIRHRAINVRVESCYSGIKFLGGGHLVKGCMTDCDYNGISIGNGTVSGNVVTNSSFGIDSSGGMITGNFASNCLHGILLEASGAGGSVIGNNVITYSSGQSGISIANNAASLVDQNTVSGPGTVKYSTGTGTVKTSNNAG